MTVAAVTPADRVARALSFQAPDRVPFFLNAHMHAARRLGLGIQQCLDDPDHVVRAQVLLRDWLGHDLVTASAPAAFELEPWGGTVVFEEVGPPNAGPPPLAVSDIQQLEPPRVDSSPRLLGVLKAFESLRVMFGRSMPILGTLVSPFSLPVMQLGFEPYLEVLLERPADFERLMKVNAVFCLEWARAQLRAGASLVLCFDPVSSPTCVPLDLARATGVHMARRFIAQLGAPCAIGMASGATFPLLDDLASTGAIAVGISAQEDLGEALRRCRGRLGVMGNFNGLEMATWSSAEAAARTREALAAGASGGLLLTDNHGEIPFSVPDDVLSAIADTVRGQGNRPPRRGAVKPRRAS